MPDETQLSLTPLLPSELQAAVEAHLIGEGWSYRTDPFSRGTTLTVQLESDDNTFRLEYSIFERVDRVLLQLIPDLSVPGETRSEVALLLGWVNAYFHCATFHLVPGRPEIRLRICLAGDLGQRVDAEAVAQITRMAIRLAEGYLPLIRAVARGEAAPQQMLPRLADPWSR